MKKFILLIAVSFIFISNATNAEKLASVLTGKIISNIPTTELQVFITESDGSILDLTSISSAGIFNLDLTIMDIPSQSEVNKLILEVKGKSDNKKKYFVKNYLNVFDETVTLNPITFK